MLTVSTNRILAMECALGNSRKTAIPYAIRNALNDQAFGARRVWAREMRSKFVLRNKWTVGSIRVVKARGINVATMHSAVGSALPYLEGQEEGTTKMGGSLPTSPAAGLAKGARPRTRKVVGRNKVSAIRLTRRVRHKNRGVETKIAIRRAKKGGKKFAYLELQSGAKGIFRVGGGKRNPTLTMLWNLAEGGYTAPAHPTLAPTVVIVRKSSPRLYRRHLKRQLARVGWK